MKTIICLSIATFLFATSIFATPSALVTEKVLKIFQLAFPEVKQPVWYDYEKYYEVVWQSKNMQDMMIIKTLLYTGIRVSELIRLNIKDIDFDRCQIRITAGK